MDGPMMAVFTGNANPQLAQDIARYLQVPLGRAHVGRFSDGEVTVELMENVRGRDVFVVQSTCPPANDHLMELLITIDALVRASAAQQSEPRVIEMVARRLRKQGLMGNIVHFYSHDKDYAGFGESKKLGFYLYDGRELFLQCMKIFEHLNSLI